MKGSVKKVEPGGLLMGTSTYLPSTHQGQKKRGESKAGSFGQGPITSSMEKSYPNRASRHGILFFSKGFFHSSLFGFKRCELEESR